MERLRRRVGIREELPASASCDDPGIIAALEARLRSIEKEIERLSCLASEAQDIERQEAFLALAQDLQRDAREIREQIRLHGS